MSTKRKAIRPTDRFEIFKRDGFTCQYCGGTPPNVVLRVDHVTPVAAGGDNDPLNLITACFDCNAGKSDKPLLSVIPSREEQIERARMLAEQTEAYNKFLMQRRRRQTRVINQLGLYWYSKFITHDKFTFAEIGEDDRVASIRTFLKHLTEAEIRDAIDIAHSRIQARGRYDQKTWKYFCGVCWSKIKEHSGSDA